MIKNVLSHFADLVYFSKGVVYPFDNLVMKMVKSLFGQKFSEIKVDIKYMLMKLR